MTSKQFIASILGLAMTVTGISAMPARALSDDDLAKILFGATALVIIGSAVSRGNDPEPVVVTRPRDPQPRDILPDRRPGRHILPRRCSRTFTLRGGRKLQAYGSGCLVQARARTQRLPQECHFKAINQYGRKVTGYKTQCLNSKGFDVSWR
ncbi:hypothetical protein shim_26790 [Shimia sp. SK013]|uniref:hypothetical protein n=1 Tax=Shimia sp. SK013 TaxID=1389006 RepID=UPI0006B5DBAE|nr:hypothetical protein [Shimia sp. SK013]KPA21214.1 hypothetical protein shim_26790 [Shimia sp. SK013]